MFFLEKNIFKTSFNNKNLYNENISDNKDYLNSDTYLTLGVESSYPLIKVNQKFEQTITPKVFSKASAGSSAYASANLSTYDDLFALNQNPLNSTSFGYGVAYAISDKNIQNQIYFNWDFSIFFVGFKTKILFNFIFESFTNSFINLYPENFRTLLNLKKKIQRQNKPLSKIFNVEFFSELR